MARIVRFSFGVLCGVSERPHNFGLQVYAKPMKIGEVLHAVLSVSLVF